MKRSLHRRRQSACKPRQPWRQPRQARHLLHPSKFKQTSSEKAALEQEANQVANQVSQGRASEQQVRKSTATAAGRSYTTGQLGRQHTAFQDLALPQPFKRSLHDRLGHSIDHTQMHTDDQAAQRAQQHNAMAVTEGNHVYFNHQQFRPDTPTGRWLIAHEITHAKQQASKAQTQPQAFTFQDCDENMVSIMNTAIARAISMLENAISLLTADPIADSTEEAFINHFGGIAGWKVSVVLLHLRRNLSLLRGGNVDYECEAHCNDWPSRAAYVWAPMFLGNIHICTPFFTDPGTSTNKRAELVIHELHHWDPVRGQIDLGGYHRRHTRHDVIWPIAVNTPDSFSKLCWDLYE